ncbi:MAG TPA: DNA-3-methyladenine glycosylase [Fibrobacteria bacterium]|nr:DNA-3-methyladenine glycosylase [Fibrobacteria bacterium]
MDLESHPEILLRSFYERPADRVAPDLLGRILSVRSGPGRVRGRIVEVEAYVGIHDLACHAAKGRTARTATMFGPPGKAYVYLVYGMHHMLNLVVAPEGDPQAVLIRALEPLESESGTPYRGPGVLCRRLGIERADDATDLCGGGKIRVETGMPPPSEEILSTPRIGVDYAKEWKDAPLRFCLRDNRHVSGTRAIRSEPGGHQRLR